MDDITQEQIAEIERKSKLAASMILNVFNEIELSRFDSSMMLLSMGISTIFTTSDDREEAKDLLIKIIGAMMKEYYDNYDTLKKGGKTSKLLAINL